MKTIKTLSLVIGLLISTHSFSAMTPQQAYIAATASIGFVEGALPDDIPHDQRSGIFFALCVNHLMSLWMEENSNGLKSNSWIQFIVAYWAGEYAGTLTKSILNRYNGNRPKKV